MSGHLLFGGTPSRASGHDEAARAFYQSRVRLFWKVVFFVTLSSSGVGLVEIASGSTPGMSHVFNALSTVVAGGYWYLCQHGQRSLRFCQFMDGGAFLIHGMLGVFLVRYAASLFLIDRSIATSEGALMADGLFLMMAQGGSAMLVGIRAALVPAAPRRTTWVSALYGVPSILAAALLEPAPGGALVWRELDSPALPWLPGMSGLIWIYATITCAVISSVIHGLRSKVRQARQLGQYTLGRKLGEGGMGEVFEARHGMMRRPSAVKLLRPEHAGEQSLKRFEREVQMTSRLTHPNTITIFDYGRSEERVFYYAMELLDGATLQRIVEVGGAQAPARVARILSMACGALKEAHAIGLIHRDIKPANIMLCTQGGEPDVAKLLDFGLVKDVSMEQGVEITQSHTVMGTPQYMAPETILRADAADARSDIYALGAVAYFLLAGVVVFDGKSVVEVCGQHLHEQPKPLSAHGVVAPQLEALIMSCLAKDPDERPQTADDLRQGLAACSLGSWTSTDAEAWWAEYRAASRPAPVDPKPTGETLAVDLERRYASS